jgi:methyl-accepting chemotaxis protein
MSFGNISVSKKLLTAFAVTVSVVLAMCVTVHLAMGRQAVLERNNSESDEVEVRIERTRGDLLRASTELRGYVLTAGKRPDIDGAFSDMNGEIGKIRQLTARAPDLQPYVDGVASAAAAWRKDAADPVLTAMAEPGGRDKATAIFSQGEATARVDDLNKAVDIAIKQTKDWSGRDTEIQVAGLRTVDFVVIVGGLLTTLIAVGMGWLLSRALGAPVVGMTAAMKRLAAGDHAVTVPSVGRGDEIGQMAAAVQTFKDAAIEKGRIEAEASAQRRQAEADRSAHEAARAEAARQQEAVVSAVAEGLDRLSQGDLIYRLNTAFAPEYEKLRADFNAAMEKLQQTVTTVAGNAGSIQAGAGEISKAADDLSRRTEQQAASLEETAAALDQITATVTKTARGATHAKQIVDTAKGEAEKSGEVVRQAVDAMNGIEQSSRQIGQIIGVIDEIAFQTNLLALNAGVEAARAGEAGRGFAVVASEVRALAQRSADAAKEIKALISTSAQEVEAGVNLVSQTNAVLEGIVAQVNQISGIVADIASSAQEQASGLSQVNTAVNQMDQVTQQNAAMVEESTAASRSLSNEANELGRLMKLFKIQGSVAARPVQAAALAPAPRAASAPRPASTPRTALKTQGRGGAAPRPAPQEDTWEEF